MSLKDIKHECIHRDEFLNLMKTVERLDASFQQKRETNGVNQRSLEDEMDRLWSLVSDLREDVAKVSLWMRINAGLFVVVLTLLLRVSGLG